MGKQNYGLRPSLLGKPNQGQFGYVTVNRQRNTSGTHEGRKFVSSQMVGGGGDGVGWGMDELSLDLPLMKEGD